MAEPENIHEQHLALDLINHSIVTNSDAVADHVYQFARVWREGVRSQQADCKAQPGLSLGIKFA